jgi:hypothetical protein
MKTLNISVLEDTLNRVEDYIPNRELINPSVSKVSVAWHLDHSLKVMNAVIKSMENSDPALYKNNFSLMGRIVFALKYIPKGKAKAPKHVLPPQTILLEDITAQLADAKQNIKRLPDLDKDAYFKHPMFGNINSTRVIRFLEAHTHHHLKIVRDILK